VSRFVLLPLPGAPGLAEPVARRLASSGTSALGRLEHRRFPDGESYLKLPDVSGAIAVVAGDLCQPNGKVLDALFLARTARDLGARAVLLLAPYLPYMRQDARFQPGEAVTSSVFAGLVNDAFDGLLTVDPHLHRHESLADIYRIPTNAVSSASLLAEWVRAEAPRAVLVGPDAESEQWVARVANEAGAAFGIMRKVRRGDYDVHLALPDGLALAGRSVLLLDDIASTGRTLIEAVGHVCRAGATRVDCLVIHPVFAGPALASLRAAGADRVVSTNTIPHETNAIDVSPLLARALEAVRPFATARG
jgi:ribose-phosphate pyrophosphokinase